jgi:hypothetical protein
VHDLLFVDPLPLLPHILAVLIFAGCVRGKITGMIFESENGIDMDIPTILWNIMR